MKHAALLSCLLACGCAGVEAVRVAEDLRLPASPELARAARSRKPALRARAARAMGRIQASGYAAQLLRLSKDPDPAVRREALFDLGQLRVDMATPAPSELADGIAAALNDPDPGARAAAVEALGKAGGDAAQERLTALLSDINPVLRREAAAGLFRLRYLKRVPEYSTAAVDALRLGLKDPDVSVRWLSAHAFSRWPEPRALVELVGAASQPDHWTRLFALRALSQIAKAAPQEDLPIQAALRALIDPEYKARVQALEVLQSARRGDLVPASLAEDPSPHVKAAAAAALEHDGDAGLLERFSKDPSPMARAQAVLSLAKRKGDGYQAALAAHLKDPHWWVRSRAALAAAELPLEGFVLLESALHDLDVRVREAAVTALGKRPGGLAEAFIAQALTDSASPLEVLGAAVAAAAERKSPGLATPLKTAYKRSTGRAYQEVRASAARALGLAPEPAPAADPSPWLGGPPPREASLVLDTDQGEVVLSLSTAAAPAHAASVLDHARKGGYDGTPWHRVVSNFVVQGGDPRGTGWGDAGYSLRDEISPMRFERGTVGMPKGGKDTGGCQLFITLVPTPHLDGRYTAFGKVVSGMEVADRLEPGDIIRKARVR